MKLEQVLNALQEPDKAEVLRPHWEDSMASLGDALPFLLDPAQVRAHCDWCGLDAGLEPLLLETARRAAADPALRALAWHCCRLLFDHDDYRDFARWPSLEAALGANHGAFYLLVAMAMVPRVREAHRRLDVAEEVTRGTCRQIWCFADNYRRGHNGEVGIGLNQVFWLRHYTAGRLFRIGRMEYKLDPFSGRVEVYRRRRDGAVLALAPDGTRFNGAGYVDGAGGVTDSEHGWTATRVVDDEAVTGCPVAPMGYAVRQEVRLPLAEWERVLGQGDVTMDMHIPAGGGMTPERCADSMRRGAEFFRRHFPDRPFRAVTCSSWIFNTQLDGILPPEANLVRYQREIYLFPVPSSGRDGLWFMFFQDSFDPATAPRETSVQRAVLDFLEAGNTWRGGGMFFLTDDLDHFGTQHYRALWRGVLP